MMYRTVIEQSFVLLTIVQLSTSDQYYVPKFTYEDIVYHLEWNESRKFCGGFAEVIVHGLCGENRAPTERGKEPSEVCCQEPCTVRKFKALTCHSNFDPRPNFDIAGKIRIPITTTTVKPPPQPTHLEIVQKFFDALQPGYKHPRISLIRI